MTDPIEPTVEAVARSLAETAIRNSQMFDTPPERVEELLPEAVEHCWHGYADAARKAIAAYEVARPYDKKTADAQNTHGPAAVSEAGKDTLRAMAAAREIIGMRPLDEHSSILVTLEHAVTTVRLVLFRAPDQAAAMLNEGLVPGVERHLSFYAAKRAGVK